MRPLSYKLGAIFRSRNSKSSIVKVFRFFPKLLYYVVLIRMSSLSYSISAVYRPVALPDVSTGLRGSLCAND